VKEILRAFEENGGSATFVKSSQCFKGTWLSDEGKLAEGLIE